MPAHYDRPEVMERINALAKTAAAKGIRIVPLACSGTEKNTECFLRALALATNGTYTFLTNHSGIGSDHLEASTDSYPLEFLNNLLTRIAIQYAYVPECPVIGPQALVGTDTVDVDANFLAQPQDSLAKAQQQQNGGEQQNIPWIKVYPNPTYGTLFVEASKDITELYLSDLSGKTIQVFSFAGGTMQELHIENYPSGVYFLRHPIGDKMWLSAKVVLVH